MKITQSLPYPAITLAGKEWCGEHMWTLSCFHGSVGNGWDVVERYIQTQDKHHAKPTVTGLVH